jgi:flagellin
MRKQIRGLDQASTNASDGISAVQTAEGALTEVHSMLQRMNELAIQAANGTNSSSDREAIQNEIEQLTTEIDRVAETTKFNETYLLKGNGKTSTANISAKDAGMSGIMTGAGTGVATFYMKDLKEGDTLNIGGQGYTIGTTVAAVRSAVTMFDFSSISNSLNRTVTINGIEYTILDDGETSRPADYEYTKAELAKLIKDQDTVIVGSHTYVAMEDSAGGSDGKADGVADNNAAIISATKAYALIANEIRKASNVGVDAGKESSVVSTQSVIFNGVSQRVFVITEGKRDIMQGLQMGLHVGADADETNKITFTIDAMDAAGLGIQNLNVQDSTGAKATYAIDSIADAIAKVSAQRSTLGAIQNRLEHTISNLDNVVENTTSAESEIRDTDMAEEMVEYSKNNILAQAGEAMLAQANQATQGVLTLLQ